LQVEAKVVGATNKEMVSYDQGSVDLQNLLSKRLYAIKVKSLNLN